MTPRKLSTGALFRACPLIAGLMLASCGINPLGEDPSDSDKPVALADSTPGAAGNPLPMGTTPAADMGPVTGPNDPTMPEPPPAGGEPAVDPVAPPPVTTPESDGMTDMGPGGPAGADDAGVPAPGDAATPGADAGVRLDFVDSGDR